MKTCYLVAVIDTTTRAVIGAGLFSDPSPTLRTCHAPAVLLSISDHPFEKALAHMRNAVKDPMWAWVRPLLGERDWREGGA